MYTRCNRCSLQDIRSREGDVTLEPAPQPGFPDGVEVRDSGGAFIAWFAALPDQCACSATPPT